MPLRRRIHELLRSHAEDDTELVSLAVRTRTADRADVRLLLDVLIRPLDPKHVSAEQLGERAVVPVVRQWVHDHPMADLPGELAAPALHAALVHEVAAFGGEFAGLEVVAIEHLIVSPSADEPDPDPDDPE